MELKDFIALATFVLVISGGLVGFGGVVYSLRRLIEDFQGMEAKVVEIEKTVNAHYADDTKHVNRPYMKLLEARLDKLEVAVETGHRRIEDKIDALTDRVAAMKR